jgi:bacteriorhodopsin
MSSKKPGLSKGNPSRKNKKDLQGKNRKAASLWVYLAIVGVAILVVFVLIRAGEPKKQTVSVGPDASIPGRSGCASDDPGI